MASRRRSPSSSWLLPWPFESKVSNLGCFWCYPVLVGLLGFSLPSTNIGCRFCGGRTEWNATSLLLPARLTARRCCAGVLGRLLGIRRLSSPPQHPPALGVSPVLTHSLSPFLGLARVLSFKVMEGRGRQRRWRSRVDDKMTPPFCSFYLRFSLFLWQVVAGGHKDLFITSGCWWTTIGFRYITNLNYLYGFKGSTYA